MRPQQATTFHGQPHRMDRLRSIRRAGWLGLGLAALTFAVALLGWPTGWWEAAANNWRWYPMSGWVTLLGLLSCGATMVLLLGRKGVAAGLFVASCLVGIGYFFVFWLVHTDQTGDQTTLANGIQLDPWGDHPAPWILVLIITMAGGGLLAALGRLERVFSSAITAAFTAALLYLLGCAYGIGYPLVPNAGAVVSIAPGLATLGLSVAIASARPHARPISWLATREGVVGLAVLVANLLLAPALLLLNEGILSRLGIEHAQDFAVIIVIIVIVGQVMVGIEYLADRGRWSRLLTIAADGVLIVRPDGVITDANAEAADILGVARETIPGTVLEQWLPEHLRERHVHLRQSMVADPRPLDTTGGRIFARRGDGEEVPVDVSVRPIRSGEELFFVVSVRDAMMADQLQAENAETRALLAEATELSVIGQVLVDAEGRVMQATAALAEMLQVSSPEDLVGRQGASLIAAADLPTAARALLPIIDGTTDTGECEVRLLAADGAVVWGHIVARSLPESSRRRVVSAQVLDITARREAEERAAAALADLQFRTTHDMLTGLPNRSALMSHLADLGARREQLAAPFAVLYCDIDNFKYVNDEFSHSAGDELLVAIANRLSARLDDGDLLARVSGDEFVLVLAEVASANTAAAAGQGLLDAIREYPFNVGLGTVHSSLSIGISLSRHDADIDTLLREADLALFAAKAHGRAQVRIFDTVMRDRADLRRRISESLSEALEQDRIHAWLQPIVRMSDRSIVGYEALARWDSDPKSIPTQDWIELADEVGLLAPVGERLLTEVIEALTQMEPELWVAVNMAGSQMTPAVVASLLRRLDAANVDPSRLVVEVMERSLVHSPDSAVIGLQDLADAGVRVFFDDFGTGQSSMTRLGELPIAGLKLHRSFTESLTEQSGPGWRLARALAEMADSLGLETIAGGVETELQEHRLLAAGWQFGQGWLFGPAQPPQSGRPPGSEAEANVRTDPGTAAAPRLG